MFSNLRERRGERGWKREERGVRKGRERGRKRGDGGGGRERRKGER